MNDTEHKCMNPRCGWVLNKNFEKCMNPDCGWQNPHCKPEVSIAADTERFVENFHNLLAEALGQLGECIGKPIGISSVEITMFPQTWATGHCGYDGGFATQAFQSAYTVIVKHQYLDTIVVGINGRIAYTVKKPTVAFLDSIVRHSVVGQSEYLENPSKWDDGSK